MSSSTERCTDCFPSMQSIIDAMFNGFNHQTVYRLLFKDLSNTVGIPLQFQSPNGVQIAFKYNIKPLTVQEKSFNHQTVYRLLCCRHISDLYFSKFQSPNGVQIAFLSEMIIVNTAKFQSPNGVQIAFQGKSGKDREQQRVSITKRCTDCFLDNVKKNISAVNVSITKRCTDCFGGTKTVISNVL